MHLWLWLAEFFLEWEIFRQKFVEKNKTHILCTINFFPWKSCHFLANVEKYDTARRATDDNISRRMRFACWHTKSTNTHSEYVMRLALYHVRNGHANAS